jgi:hypothetical protein
MPHIYLKNKLQCVYPYQIDFQEEKEELEYWESEDNKSDDEMNELSDDPDLEKEDNEYTNIGSSKKDENETKSKKDQEDTSESESEDEEEGIILKLNILIYFYLN